MNALSDPDSADLSGDRSQDAKLQLPISSVPQSGVALGLRGQRPALALAPLHWVLSNGGGLWLGITVGMASRGTEYLELVWGLWFHPVSQRGTPGKLGRCDVTGERNGKGSMDGDGDV